MVYRKGSRKGSKKSSMKKTSFKNVNKVVRKQINKEHVRKLLMTPQIFSPLIPKLGNLDIGNHLSVTPFSSIQPINIGVMPIAWTLNNEATNQSSQAENNTWFKLTSENTFRVERVSGEIMLSTNYITSPLNVTAPRRIRLIGFYHNNPEWVSASADYNYTGLFQCNNQISSGGGANLNFQDFSTPLLSNKELKCAFDTIIYISGGNNNEHNHIHMKGKPKIVTCTNSATVRYSFKPKWSHIGVITDSTGKNNSNTLNFYFTVLALMENLDQSVESATLDLFATSTNYLKLEVVPDKIKTPRSAY